MLVVSSNPPRQRSPCPPASSAAVPEGEERPRKPARRPIAKRRGSDSEAWRLASNHPANEQKDRQCKPEQDEARCAVDETKRCLLPTDGRDKQNHGHANRV